MSPKKPTRKNLASEIALLFLTLDSDDVEKVLADALMPKSLVAVLAGASLAHDRALSERQRKAAEPQPPPPPRPPEPDSPPTQADLDLWSERVRQAAPGPWFVEEDWTAEIHGPDGSLGCFIYPYEVGSAMFAAEARRAVPMLLAEVVRLRKALLEARDAYAAVVLGLGRDPEASK